MATVTKHGEGTLCILGFVWRFYNCILSIWGGEGGHFVAGIIPFVKGEELFMLLKRKKRFKIKQRFAFQSRCLYFGGEELRDDVASVFFSGFPHRPASLL